MKYKILYGLANNNIDVTQTVIDKCISKDIFHIPKDDDIRARLLTDPLFGTLKSIFIVDGNSVKEYSHERDIYIDGDTIYTDLDEDMPSYIDTKNKLLREVYKLWGNLTLDFGTFVDELPEQLMAIKYLKGNENVLEIGGNIGRNSLIISSILEKGNGQLIVLESDIDISRQLEHNKRINGKNFIIENSALSKRALIQQGWNTKVLDNDEIPEGYKKIPTITLNELSEKYNISFNTLVLDCEGAFYYILLDMPEILNGIETIIMENDYHNVEHKNYIDGILKMKGFTRNYREMGGWGQCYENFFEVWILTK